MLHSKQEFSTRGDYHERVFIIYNIDFEVLVGSYNYIISNFSSLVVVEYSKKVT